MIGSKSDWLGIVGSPLVALGLLWLLRGLVPPGMALALAVTTAMTWGYYWKNGSLDMAVVPVTIALAFATAGFFPDQWHGPIAILFVIGGILFGKWLQQRRRLSAPTTGP